MLNNISITKYELEFKSIFGFRVMTSGASEVYIYIYLNDRVCGRNKLYFFSARFMNTWWDSGPYKVVVW